MSDKKEIEELKAKIEELEKNQGNEDHLEEIKETVKRIEEKPGCLGQIGWAVLIFIGFIVIMNIFNDY